MICFLKAGWRRVAVGAVAFLLLLPVTGCIRGGTPSTPAQSAPPSLEEEWGIQIASLRVSAAGRIIDFRYRVVDPAQAARLGDRKLRPCLIDQASGTKLGVPNAPKVGALRQNTQPPIAGRIYFILFSNPGKAVKAGSKVTVVIGDCRVENLTVE